MGRVKDKLFWWLPVRNRLFMDKYNELQETLNQMKNEILYENKKTNEELNEIKNKLSDKARIILDIMNDQHERDRREWCDMVWRLEQQLRTVEWKNDRLERILTHYHKQDMKMFWEEYRRDGENTLEAQKRFFLSLPKAQGYERNLQLLEVILLNGFVKICEENQLNYWLAFGTLLGAVRHKGFIPWDDDIDTCMAREDIDRLQEIMKDNTEYCLTVKYDPIGECKQIRFWFKNSENPVFLDIFPYDWTVDSDPEVWNHIRDARQDLVREITDESNPLIREFRAAGCVDEDSEIGQKIKQIFDKYSDRLYEEGILCEKEKASGCLYSFDSCGFTDHSTMIAKELYYPLKKAEFEGGEYNVPNQSEYLLQQQFGLDFYTFPCGEPHFIHADWKRNQKVLEEEVQKRIGK